MKLFEIESPELANGTIEIKHVAREAGSRSKLAVMTHDDHIDPVGSLVGQRGVRVSTVTSELGGEKIDIIEWSEDDREFIERALSPAEILNVEVSEDEDGMKRAEVEVTEDQQSLAIGRGGQNVRLAAKLTGWAIDIKSTAGEALAETDASGDVEVIDDAPAAPADAADEVVEETTDAREEVTNESTDEAPVETEEATENVAEETDEEKKA